MEGLTRDFTDRIHIAQFLNTCYSINGMTNEFTSEVSDEVINNVIVQKINTFSKTVTMIRDDIAQQ